EFDLRPEPDKGDRWEAGARPLVVRQRVGLLQPHGRYRRRHGEARVRRCSSARHERRAGGPGGEPPTRLLSSAYVIVGLMCMRTADGDNIAGGTAGGL